MSVQQSLAQTPPLAPPTSDSPSGGGKLVPTPDHTSPCSKECETSLKPELAENLPLHHDDVIVSSDVMVVSGEELGVREKVLEEVRGVEGGGEEEGEEEEEGPECEPVVEREGEDERGLSPSAQLPCHPVTTVSSPHPCQQCGGSSSLLTSPLPPHTTPPAASHRPSKHSGTPPTDSSTGSGSSSVSRPAREAVDTPSSGTCSESGSV